MSIQFRCPSCTKRLRVSVDSAGKKARCPRCGEVCRVPQESENEFATVRTGNKDDVPDRVAERFFVDSIAGRTFGPVELNELANWADQGRISANCLIRSEFTSEAKPAFAYFPHLGKPDHPTATRPPTAHPAASVPQVGPAPASFANPYEIVSEGTRKSRIKVVKPDPSRIFGHTTDVFKTHLGSAVGAVFPVMIASFLGGLCRRIPLYFARQGILLDPPVQLLFTIGEFITIFAGLYFFVGQTQVLVKMSTGKPFKLYHVVLGMGRFGHLLAFWFMTFGILSLVLLLFSYFVEDLMFLAAVILTFLSLSAAVSFFFWSGFLMVADGRAGPLEALQLAPSVTFKNLLNVIILFAATFGIMLAGLIACGIGLFFSAGYVAVLWTVAYLMMTGKIEFRKHKDM